jgi:tRNA-2-methylthio-N6-dimethylallyladenosine synthase
MPRYSLVTFGCQMNEHDSARMREVLEGAGYLAVEHARQADVVVVNTCTVREKAEQKLRSQVGRLGVLKRRRPDLVIAVAGCVAQQEGERLLRDLPQIDLVLGPDNIPELPGLLAELAGGGPPRVRTEFDLESPQFLRARPRPGGVAPCAYVTVMKGCDERCSFCIVPYTRGPERYRPAAEIVQEIQRLVAAGVREVTLLGQTVNSYADPAGGLPRAPGSGESPWRHTQRTRAQQDESEFPALLRAIAAAVPELARLRYTSPHPRHLTRSLILAHEQLPVLARHVHLPVQSGSDRVLKRMIRRYSVDEYVERTQALQAAVPGLTVTTDIIVGFPGEVTTDFEQTLQLIERVGFVGLFGFKYSARPFTPALKLGDDVSELEKKERLAAVFALSERLRRAHLERQVGTEQAVLVEGRGEGQGYTGRTDRNAIVHFGCKEDPTGELVDVRITEAFKNSLAGMLTDSQRAAPIERAATTVAAAKESGRRALPVV